MTSNTFHTMLGLILIAFAASSVYKAVKDYEEKIEDIVGGKYSQLNNEYSDVQVKDIARCILTQKDISSCADWVKMREFFSGVDEEAIKAALNDFAETEVSQCPRTFPVPQYQIARLNKLTSSNELTLKKRDIGRGIGQAINSLFLCVGVGGIALSGTLIVTSALSIAAVGAAPFSVVGVVVGALFFLPSLAITVVTATSVSK